MIAESFCVRKTNFTSNGLDSVYHGKVRDVYTAGDYIIMVASDRISAFDCILPKSIPYKGQVLNGIATHFLENTKDIVPNWLISTPHPNISIGHKAEPFKVEVVIRGYLAGHAWRTYQQGIRSLCGVILPEGLRQNDAFPQPVITPTTKADRGHDEDISVADILSTGYVSEEDWTTIENYTRALFSRGSEMARARGLLLVDTKYEFGKNKNGDIILIDEVHTPDSSRYFIAETYDQNQKEGKPQQQLSKEFVREWLISQHFQGKEGDVMPEMPEDFVWLVSNRYIDLYERITGKAFIKADSESILDDMENAINNWLASHNPI
jgi:phosphoribosylaminoimidazole-succinocarboxamide synthase